MESNAASGTKTKKIALVIAGGGSLGAFEAGVLTELSETLERLNRDAEKNGVHYEIDVISAASAGSLNAAVLACTALQGRAGYRDVLRKLWIERADIENMIANGSAKNALFTLEFQKSLFQEFIFNPSSRASGKASFIADRVYMNFALSNMAGMDFRAAPPGGEPENEYCTVFFRDNIKIELMRNEASQAEKLNNIMDAALASSAIPLIFPPMRLLRHKGDYKNPGEIFKNADQRCIPYTDGGILNNEPLREALRLARRADGDDLSPDRLFILVDPNINPDVQDSSLSTAPLPGETGDSPPTCDQSATPDKLDFLGCLDRLGNTILGEIGAQDWLRGLRLNNQLAWRDDLIEYFRDVLKNKAFACFDGKNLEESLDRQINAVVRVKFDQKTSASDSEIQSAEKFRDKRLERIEKTHGELLNSLELSENGDRKRELLKKWIFLINSAGGLDSKFPANFAVIGSSKEKTRCDILQGLGGFFDENWRKYDFTLGGNTARERLPIIFDGLPSFEPFPLPGGNSPADEPKIQDADKSKLALFTNHLVAFTRARVAEQPLFLGPIGVFAAGFILKWHLKNYFQLRFFHSFPLWVKRIPLVWAALREKLWAFIRANPKLSLGLGALILTFIAALPDFSDRRLIIDDFKTPAKLSSDSGLTGGVVASRLMDRVKKLKKLIYRENSGSFRLFSGSADSYSVDVETFPAQDKVDNLLALTGTGISFTQVQTLYSSLRGSNVAHAGGDLTFQNGQYNLVVRLRGEALGASLQGKNLPHLLDQAAERILFHMEPISLAEYYMSLPNGSKVREMTELLKVANLHPHDIALIQGWIFYQERKAKEAIEKFTLASHFKPGSVLPYSWKALTLIQLKRAEDALALLKKNEAAIKKSSDAYLYYSAWGYALRKKEQWAEARKKLELSLAMRPNYFYTSYNLAVVYSNSNRREEAEKIYRELFSLDPARKIILYIKRGMNLYALDQKEKALQILQEGCRIKRARAGNCLAYAHILRKEEKYEAAREALLRARKLPGRKSVKSKIETEIKNPPTSGKKP